MAVVGYNFAMIYKEIKSGFIIHFDFDKCNVKQYCWPVDSEKMKYCLQGCYHEGVLRLYCTILDSGPSQVKKC